MTSIKYEPSLSCAIISDPTGIPTYSSCYERKIEAHHRPEQLAGTPFKLSLRRFTVS